jgi:hypothetical protein
MFTNPGITADLAAQYRRELTAQARACRQARSAVRPSARPTVRRVVASLAAAAAAAAVLVTSPVGGSHLAANYRAQHFYAGHLHDSHFRGHF